MKTGQNSIMARMWYLPSKYMAIILISIPISNQTESQYLTVIISDALYLLYIKKNLWAFYETVNFKSFTEMSSIIRN